MAAICACLPFPEQSQLGPQGCRRAPRQPTPRAMRALGPSCRRGSPRSEKRDLYSTMPGALAGCRSPSTPHTAAETTMPSHAPLQVCECQKLNSRCQSTERLAYRCVIKRHALPVASEQPAAPPHTRTPIRRLGEPVASPLAAMPPKRATPLPNAVSTRIHRRSIISVSITTRNKHQRFSLDPCNLRIA